MNRLSEIWHDIVRQLTKDLEGEKLYKKIHARYEKETDRGAASVAMMDYLRNSQQYSRPMREYTYCDVMNRILNSAINEHGFGRMDAIDAHICIGEIRERIAPYGAEHESVTKLKAHMLKKLELWGKIADHNGAPYPIPKNG